MSSLPEFKNHTDAKGFPSFSRKKGDSVTFEK